MLLIHRILLSTTNSNELLFDLDFSNLYRKDAIKAVIKSATGDPPPIYSLDALMPPRSVCIMKTDQVNVVLMCEKLQLTALEKAMLLKLTKDYVSLCQSFLGSLNQQNILTNVARLAELTDHIFVCGRTHLLSADRLKGFITTPYIEPSSQNVHGLPSQLLSTTKVAALPLSIQRPHIHHQKILAPQTPAASGSRSISSTSNDGSSKLIGGGLYVDLIETVTLTSNRDVEPVVLISGSLNTNNTTSAPIDLHFKFKNSDQIGQDLKFHKSANGSRFEGDQELVVNGAPVGQASLLSYSRNLNLKDNRSLFTLQVVHIKNGENDGLKFLLQCNTPHGSVSMKTSVSFKLPASFTQHKGVISIFKKLPAHSIHIKPSGKNEVFKANEKELQHFHSDVELVWMIPEIHGQVACELAIQFLPGRNKPDSTATTKLDTLDARMTFEISNYLASGARLTGVRLDKHLSSGVKKWVRQLTASGTVYDILCTIHS